MGNLIMTSKKGYTNEDAVRNVVNYLYRAFSKEDPTEQLILFSGHGVSANSGCDKMIEEITYVQMACRSPSTIGTRVFHEIFTFTPEEAGLFQNRYDLLRKVAGNFAKIYFAIGHQIVYAVHYGEFYGLHIHFVGNAVNFYDGTKWYNNKTFLYDRECMMNQILEQYLIETGKEIFL